VSGERGMKFKVLRGGWLACRFVTRLMEGCRYGTLRSTLAFAHIPWAFWIHCLPGRYSHCSVLVSLGEPSIPRKSASTDADT
jgi:hypothetical protein